MRYYYADESNQAVGPVAEAELKSLQARGIIGNDTFVIKEGGDSWVALEDVLGSAPSRVLNTSTPQPTNTTSQLRPPVPARPSSAARIIWLIIFIIAAGMLVLRCGGFKSLTGATRVTKAEWRAKLVQHYGVPAQMNTIANWSAVQFKSLMGEPDRTQVLGDQAYWYYECTDGTIQLDLYAPNLAGGVMQGDINDF